MKSLITLLVLSAGLAFGQASQVTSSAALSPNDSVSWAQFGPTTAQVLSPAVATTANSSTAIVSLPSAGLFFERRDQNNGWSGNFGNGEALLWNKAQGTILINPADLVFGAGAQIQANQFGAFQARIQAFDSLGALVGSFTQAGNSTSIGDDSAIYIGFSSLVAIDYFSFSLIERTDFAIGQVDLVTEGRNPPPVTPVPEPSTYGLMAGAALAGLGFLRRRRKA